MFRLKPHATTFALIIGLLTTFTQTARAESWSWESLFSFGWSANAFPVCTTDPLVTSTFNSGTGTLRQAVIDACPGSTIRFLNAGNGYIALDGEIVIDKNVVIQGPGAYLMNVLNRQLTGPNSRVFYVNSGVTATISGLNISNGKIYPGIGGGGIYNLGNLTVEDSVIQSNEVYGGVGGGGIYSASGTLNVINTLVYNNDAGSGGGVFSSGTVTITGSAIFSNNGAQRGGGLFLNGPSTATITNTTVSNNRTYDGGPGLSDSGGGIYVDASTLTLVNSTIANNVAFSLGGGIYNFQSTVYSRNSIIAANTGVESDFSGTLTSQGFNLIGNTGGTNIGGTMLGNIVNQNALLGPLANNGGLTWTHALLPGSPAIDAGNAAPAPSTDQRAAPRVGAADIGAYEFNSTAPIPTPTPTPTPTPMPNTPTGSNVTAQSPSGDAGVTFALVTIAGNTAFTPLVPPSSAGTPPAGYTILDGAPAYDITTTADYTPPVTVCFTVSSVNDSTTFARVRILHGENGELVDRTILAPDTPAPDFATRSVCARVNSLSPFVVALAPNMPPSAGGDTYSVDEDTTLNIDAPGVLGNDTDGENNSLTATLVANAANGSATLNADGSFSYTPNANFNGTDSFTYKASDGSLASNAATVTITVSSVNDNPDAVNDSATVTEDSGANTINVRSNDGIAPDTGETLVVTAITQGANGSVAITNSGANVSYTMNANFNGTDSFTYTISDGSGGTDTAGVSITVTAVNDNPDAVNDSATLMEDSGANAVSVLGNDGIAPDIGETLTVSSVTQGANGAVIITGSTGVSYTPNADFNGTDSFTYTISDGSGGTDTAGVSITVTAVNDSPNAVNDSASVAEDSSANSLNVRANDVDPDGDSLSITAVTQAANGTAAITGGGTNVSYTPNTNFNGADSFTYTISDGNGGSDTATVNITVTSVNDAPDAVNDSATVDEDSGANAVSVFANDTILPDTGETLSITAKTNGANGTVAITGGGTGLTYAPNAGFNGSDSFTYTVSDGNGGTDTATVNVTVTPVNDVPVLDAIGNKMTNEGAAVTFMATGNDAADSPPNSLTFSLIGAPAGATITAAGAFSWTPTEAQGPGTFTFRVRVTDNGTPNLFADEEITVTVREVNAAPVLGAIGNKSGYWGNALGFTAAATDSDLPANTLTYTLAGTVPNGASITTGGVFTWTPTSMQLGTHNFTVLVTDNGSPLLSDSKTFTITIGKRPTALVYSGASAGQYSDSVTLTATLADNGGGSMQGLPLLSKTIGFTLGSQSASGVTNASGVAGKSLTLTQMAQALNVLSQFGGDALYNPSGDSDPFTINKENVETTYTGDSLIFTAGPSIGTASSVRLGARLTQLDSELGDLTLARVRFELFKFSNSTTTPTFTFGNIAVDAAGNAETTIALAVDDAYTVRVVIEAANGYWTANPAGEGMLVVAYGTTARRVTGGGWVPDAATANNKGHFGFTVNYRNSGSPSGNALYMFRGTDGYNYRIKSNSWQGGGLTFYGEPWKAAFSGKCNVQKIDPLTGATIQSSGNYTFTVDLIDGDLKNPRETDRYAIQILTDTGAIWRQVGTRTNPLALGGGNVAVKSN